MKDVYITRIASFLPNEPISNDDMEKYLGVINQQASKSRRIVLRNNGIKTRYYALTREGVSTHTNSEMASLAIKKLMNNNKEELASIDLISCATSSPEQLMPSHAVMVHGHLPETGNVEVVSPSGVCCAGMHALKYAYMSVKLGQAHRAVSSASERLSPSLRADKFELEVKKLSELEANPYVSFDKDFLRWMLSDGAGAFLLESQLNNSGISLRIDWIEGFSFANEMEACMYMGADKLEDGTLKSYLDYTPQEIVNKSILSIKQDVKLLGANIVSLGFKKLKSSIESKGMDVNEIDHFLPHMSSFFFEDKMYNEMKSLGIEIPKEKWFTNLGTKGNVGAASIYLMLDELFNSGKLQKGQKILLGVPESSRFSYVYCMLTVC
ncbi:MAG: beta-ketoacyl-ACP synthase III [Crocinitomicaceae bacterium]|nr:beta-ketoacyl-ACP synthase III [Crocinitomicaceae bacterium]